MPVMPLSWGQIVRLFSELITKGAVLTESKNFALMFCLNLIVALT